MAVRAKSPDYSLPLLSGMMQPAPPPPPTKSWWQGWTFRAITAASTGACVAARVATTLPILKGVTTFGIGFGLQSLFDSFWESKDISRVHSITASLQSGFTTLVATQIYENIENDQLKMGLTALIVCMLGANMAMFRKQATEHHFATRIENKSEAEDELSAVEERPVSNETFRGIFLNQTFSDGLRLIATGTAGAALYYVSDPIMHDVVSYFVVFYPLAIVGGRVASHVDRKILTASGPTHWRTAKTAITTLATLSPLAFIPFFSSGHFYLLGAIQGFFDENLARSIKDRITHVPISRIEELTPTVKSKIRKVTEVVLPLTLSAGFGIWQIGWDLSKKAPDSKIACGLLTGTFCVSYGAAKLKKHFWNREERMAKTGPLSISTRIRDLMLCKMKFDPRFMGMTLALYSFVIMNSMEMNNKSLEEQNQIRRAAIQGAYATLGLAAALELDRLLTSGLFFPLPIVALKLGTGTLEGLMRGKLQ